MSPKKVNAAQMASAVEYYTTPMLRDHDAVRKASGALSQILTPALHELSNGYVYRRMYTVALKAKVFGSLFIKEF